jgi:hypothetical protein
MIVVSFSSDIDRRSSADWRRATTFMGYFHNSTSTRLARLFGRPFGQRIAGAAAAFIFLQEAGLHEIADVAQRCLLRSGTRHIGSHARRLRCRDAAVVVIERS